MLLTSCRISAETICMQHIAVAKAQTIVEMIFKAHTLNNRSCKKMQRKPSGFILQMHVTGLQTYLIGLIIAADTIYSVYDSLVCTVSYSDLNPLPPNSFRTIIYHSSLLANITPF